MLVVCIAQSCTKTEYDVNVIYAGSYDFVEKNDLGDFASELSEVLPTDFNRDGEKNAGLISYWIMTEDQIEEYNQKLLEKKENGEQVSILNTGFLSEQRSSFNTNLLAGQYAILLVDESLYLQMEKVKTEKGTTQLKALSEIFVTVPQSAFSDYGIRFSETALYKNSDHFKNLPENTVLCLANPLITSDKKQYANSLEMFKAMAKD